MAKYDRFNAVILIGDSSRRGKLKQAALAMTSFNKVFPAPVMTEALSKINGYDEVDVVFISFDFGWDKIIQFVKEAKATPHGDKLSFVLVLKPGDEKDENVAKSVFAGIHSCLYEPYSADNLRVIAQMAAKIKEEAEVKREKAAIQKLLLEIIKHIDALSFYQRKGKNPEAVFKKLRSACSSLNQLGPDAQTIYHELVLELFAEAKPFGSEEYKGVSERIRKIVQDKLAVRMEQEYSE